jgi:hypothetical protein
MVCETQCRKVPYCVSKQVPYTVTRRVAHCVAKQVPVCCTRMVARCVPRQVAYEVCQMVPVTVCPQPCDPCVGGGCASGNCGTGVVPPGDAYPVPDGLSSPGATPQPYEADRPAASEPQQPESEPNTDPRMPDATT